jgi:hypothetical protein
MSKSVTWSWIVWVEVELSGVELELVGLNWISVHLELNWVHVELELRCAEMVFCWTSITTQLNWIWGLRWSGIRLRLNWSSVVLNWADLTVAFSRSWLWIELQLEFTWRAVSEWASPTNHEQLIALMMYAARTSETLAYFYQTTRCYNPEDSHISRLCLFVFLDQEHACKITEMW